MASPTALSRAGRFCGSEPGRRVGLQELQDLGGQPVVLHKEDTVASAGNPDQLRLWNGVSGQLRIRTGRDPVSGPVDHQGRLADLREWILGKSGQQTGHSRNRRGAGCKE